MSELIIVGVTDAQASRRAIAWAAHRARDTGAPVELISVIGGAVGAAGEEDVLSEAVAGVTERVEQAAAELAASGVAARVRVETGNPTSVLVDASKDAALLVIGGEPHAHSRRGQHGSRIAAGAHCPVVVVPSVADSDPRHGVVVGVDGSDVSDAAIEFAAVEAERLGEPLTVVSAWMPVAIPGDFGVYPDVYLSDLEGISRSVVDGIVERVGAAHPALHVEGRIGEGDPASVVVEAASTAVLVVVGSHGRGGFARFLLGSVSEEVVAHLPAVTAVVR